MSLRESGWVWEGQGLDPGVPPSIYGLGQGTKYLGLSRANFLFHPNDEYALTLLEDLDEVTCSILKDGFQWTPDGGVKFKREGDAATVRAEAENVARLSTRFKNITGAFFDDALGRIKKGDYGPEEFGQIRELIREINPDLKMWTVVYTHEFGDADLWRAISPHVDVVSLWVWNSTDLVNLREYVKGYREIFPGKPVIMGVYLRDYAIPAPVPVERVTGQMEVIADLMGRNELAGYSVLASILFDGHRRQAEAIRDFIAKH